MFLGNLIGQAVLWAAVAAADGPAGTGAGAVTGAAAITGASGSALPAGIPLEYYVAVSAVVFGIGVLIIVLRRNAIAVLMGLELLLNAAGLNFIAFSKFVTPGKVDGQIFTLFIIVIAAAEAALALAITLNIFNNLNTIEVDEARALKG